MCICSHTQSGLELLNVDKWNREGSKVYRKRENGVIKALTVVAVTLFIVFVSLQLFVCQNFAFLSMWLKDMDS